MVAKCDRIAYNVRDTFYNTPHIVTRDNLIQLAVWVYNISSNYASRRSCMRDTVKLTVCVSVPAVTTQRLQCDEN